MLFWIWPLLTLALLAYGLHLAAFLCRPMPTKVNVGRLQDDGAPSIPLPSSLVVLGQVLHQTFCLPCLLPLTGMSVVNRYNMVTGVPPWPMLKH